MSDPQRLELKSVACVAWIGLGANIGNAPAICHRAVACLHGHPRVRVVAQSPFYCTEPIGPIRQSWYVNAVVAVESRMGPRALLRLLHHLETSFGRNRPCEKRWGPRRLDLDLLFYGHRVIRCRDLRLPHPRLHQRRFVLRPLCDIAPSFVHPVFGKTVDIMLRDVDDSARVEPLSFEWGDCWHLASTFRPRSLFRSRFPLTLGRFPSLSSFPCGKMSGRGGGSA